MPPRHQSKAPNLRRPDKYDYMAADAMTVMTQDSLAKIFRDTAELMVQKDCEHRNNVLVISALLELLGGHTVLPAHALKNALGYESIPGPAAGDITLRNYTPDGESHE
jgi:hypothetical protein